VRRGLIVACAVQAVLIVATPARAERKLASSGGLEAATPAQDICLETLPVTVRAPDAAAFKGDRKELLRLIARARGKLELECEGKTQPRTLAVVGEVAGKEVYRDTVRTTVREVRAGAPAPAPPEKAVIAGPVAPPASRRCDELAAHPADPQRPPGVNGVSDQALNVQAAFEACLAAVDASPDEARLAFQLGRVLMLGGEPEQATGFLSDAAAGGSAAALAYLGDLEGETESALELYRAAAEGGFSPAAALVTEPERQPEQQAPGPEPGPLCDQLAAHPDDPRKPRQVAGVKDDDLDSAKAADACLDAANVSPEEPRYRFQLGRAFRWGGMDKEALEVLTAASDKGYAAAKAYLADLTEDSTEAERLYQEAAKGGFKPAETVLSQLEEALAPPQEEDGEGHFHRNDFIVAVLNKRGIDLTEDDAVYYFNGFFGYLYGECAWPGSKASKSAIDDYVDSAQGVYADMVMRNSRNPSAMFEKAGKAEATHQNGVDDASYFKEDNGCNGKKMINFVENFAALLR
jgi:TPR repeat protein